MEVILSIVGVIISAIGLTFFLKDRFNKSSHGFECDEKNITFVDFWSHGNIKSGNLGLLIYNFKIKNLGTKNFTVKSFQIEYLKNNKIITEDSFVLKTSVNKENKDYIIIKSKKSYISIVGWKNAREILANNAVISEGGVFSASAFFYFEATRQEADSIQDIKIKIEDFSGTTSTHELPMQKNWSDNLDEKYILFNKIH